MLIEDRAKAVIGDVPDCFYANGHGCRNRSGELLVRKSAELKNNGGKHKYSPIARYYATDPPGYAVTGTKLNVNPVVKVRNYAVFAA